MSQALSNSSNSETKNPLRISLSNFDCKKKNHLQVLIKKLGGAYDENLEYGTNILIAANPLSNKYKVLIKTQKIINFVKRARPY